MDTQRPGKPEAHDNERKSDDDKKQGDQQPQEEKRTPLWPWLLAGAVVIGFIAVVLAIIYAPDPDVWTDDAYVTAHYASVAPRVAGQVVSVDVHDNEEVQAGQVLATLDPRDFQTSVDQAEAQLARDQANVQNTSALIGRQPSEIDENSAQTDEVRAQLALAEANARRYTNLAAVGAGPKEQAQQAQATLRVQQAQLAAAIAALQASQHQLDVLKAQRASAQATVEAARSRGDRRSQLQPAHLSGRAAARPIEAAAVAAARGGARLPGHGARRLAGRGQRADRLRNRTGAA